MLFSGDVIRLKHAETAGFLCFDEISIKKPTKNVYVRIYKGIDENDRMTTNNLFEIEAHNESRQLTTQNQGSMLQWKQKGQVQMCTVRLRHLNSGKLLCLKWMDKKKKSKTGKPKKQLVLTLASNITAEEVNYRLERIHQIEVENRFNSNFNALTNPEITQLSSGVGPD